MSIPSMYLSRRFANTVWFTRTVANFTSSDICLTFLLDQMQQFLNEEHQRWNTGESLLFNINATHADQLHVLELILSYFHSTHHYNTGHDAMLVLLDKFEPYFLHQLQVEYQPSLHAGVPLLARITRSNLQVADFSKPRIGKFVSAWLQALSRNPHVRGEKDDKGNNIVAQLVKNELESALTEMIKNADDNVVTGLLDSIFDRNHDGESAKDMTGGSANCRTLVEQMHRDWYYCSRKYIHCILVNHIISDIADLSLDFIDGGSKPIAASQ